jgi:hypothetical protein
MKRNIVFKSKLNTWSHYYLAASKIKGLFSLKYPKLALLVIIITFSYFLFSNPRVEQIISTIDSLGYIGIFIAGILFSFGFTSPIAVGLLITLNPQNLIFASIIGGLGALSSDLTIFRIIKFSFMDEFSKIKRTPKLVKSAKLMEIKFGKRFTHYLMLIIAAIFIASPLPDEIGIPLLAGLAKIQEKTLAIISFALNTLGIFIILYF